MKTHPSSQTLGFFDVELRVPWLGAKGNPLSPSSEAETTDFKQNYTKVSPPPQLNTLNAIDLPEPCDILHIVGQGFDGNPDNH